MTFRSKSQLTHEYSNKRFNIKRVDKDNKVLPVYLNLAVSAENGVEGYVTHDKPLNSQDFCQIFNEIMKNGKKFHMFLDNCSIHRSRFTNSFC